MKLTRRSFIKSTSAGVMGLGIGENILASPKKEMAWTNGMKINPNISNTKVVCCYDPDMYPGEPSSNFSTVNQTVNANKVYSNMDEMAKKLTGKNDATEAWKTIFRSGKSWEETRVAIKVNCINTQHLNRVAIIKKISDVLVGFGVKPANIILYDGCSDAMGDDKRPKFNVYASLTDSSKILATVSQRFNALNGTTAVTISGASEIVCAKDLVDGNIDILIDIAVNKGHGSEYGGVTLCMKNHFGTFVNSSGSGAGNLHANVAPNALYNINKHDAILGGNPVRQQLCIIDSLLASQGGPMNGPNSTATGGKPCRIIMGTFAPTVDYCCVKKVREGVNKWTHNNTVVNRFLSEFGYSESDIEWIEFTPQVNVTNYPEKSNKYRLDFILSNSSIKKVVKTFYIPENVPFVNLTVYDLRGMRLGSESVNITSEGKILWNGKINNSNIADGKYLIKLSSQKFERSDFIELIR